MTDAFQGALFLQLPMLGKWDEINVQARSWFYLPDKFSTDESENTIVGR